MIIKTIVLFVSSKNFKRKSSYIDFIYPKIYFFQVPKLYSFANPSAAFPQFFFSTWLVPNYYQRLMTHRTLIWDSTV